MRNNLFWDLTHVFTYIATERIAVYCNNIHRTVTHITLHFKLPQDVKALHRMSVSITSNSKASIFLRDITLYEESSYINNNYNPNCKRKFSNLFLRRYSKLSWRTESRQWKLLLVSLFCGVWIWIETEGVLIKLYVNHSIHYNQ
jgi:hypothetical protein